MSSNHETNQEQGLQALVSMRERVAGYVVSVGKCVKLITLQPFISFALLA